MALICLSCAWVVGIFLGSKLNLPLASIFSGLILLPLLFFLRQYRKIISLASLCLIAFFAGAFYFQTNLPTVDDNCLQFYNNREAVEINGIIDRAPEVRDKATQLHLNAIEIKSDNQWHKVSGTALIFVPRYPTYRYGDVLLVTGKLRTPPQLDDFDYEDCVVTITSSITGIMPVISTLWPSSHTWIFSISRAKRFVSKSSVVSF